MLPLLALLACAPHSAPSTPAPVVAAAPFDSGAHDGVVNPTLAALLDDHWEAALRDTPRFASDLGDRRYDALLANTFPDEHRRQAAQRVGFLARAKAIEPTTLSASDRLTWQLFTGQLTAERDLEVCKLPSWALLPRDNPITTLGWLAELRPLASEADIEALEARYRAFQPYVTGQVVSLREGARAGRFANAESTQRVLQMVRDQLAQPAEAWSAVTAVSFAPGAVSAERELNARASFALALDQRARPALMAYADFLEAEVLPHARGGAKEGLHALGPDGLACYDALIRYHTSLDVDAETLHQRGLDELERVHAELRVVGQRVYGTDDLPTIFERLRTDPALHFKDADAIEAKAQASLAKARAALPAWFGRLPKTECVVRRIPDHEAPYTTVAYYRPPAQDGSRPGEYRVNVYEPTTRPSHEAQVLAFHESIPGHHLQIAIGQELPAIPAFRRLADQTAFVEGWALYSERLADEMGLYDGDLDRLGMLAFDAWRAGRLVVDTGVHHDGWTRSQAVRFLHENTPLADNNIGNEVDRYISWPGQALAYKTGQLELLKLRAEAETALGDDFDVRAFHDVVLGSGAVTLPILDEQVRAWVSEQGK